MDALQPLHIRAWREVDWRRVEQRVELINFKDRIKAWNAGEDIGEFNELAVVSLIELLVGYAKLLIDAGEFTPHSINSEYQDRPREILWGWLYEGAEEYLINAVL